MISSHFPYNQVASLDMVPDCTPCPPVARKTTVKLKQSERIPMIPRVTHTRLPEGRQDFKLRATINEAMTCTSSPSGGKARNL